MLLLKAPTLTLLSLVSEPGFGTAGRKERRKNNKICPFSLFLAHCLRVAQPGADRTPRVEQPGPPGEENAQEKHFLGTAESKPTAAAETPRRSLSLWLKAVAF